MDKKLIEEMWSITEQGECPVEFISFCEKYHRRMSAFAPRSFDERDFAVCATFYEFASIVCDGQKRKGKANG